MSRRLVKIAKELNVGTATIVEHLTKSGFDIENKPTAKITDDMYSELLKEFQGSIAVKEEADKLILGTRPGAEGKPETGKKAPDTGDRKPDTEPSETEIKKALASKIGTAKAADKNDLKKITGVGPKLESVLNGIGIYTFEQVSKMGESEYDLLDNLLGSFKGRAKRDDWAGQAKELMKKG